MMAQILTTAVFSLTWTCLFLGAFAVLDFKNIKTPMVYAVIITFYCYYLNNVKSFYVSILTSQSFRQKFKEALINRLPRRIRQQIRSSNISNVTRARTNNREDIPLQPNSSGQ